MIEFKVFKEKTVLFDPEGRLFEQEIEHRVDPLMGNVASINTFLGEKAKAFLGAADTDLMRELEEKTKSTCPFCNVFEKGTRFNEDFDAEGRLVKERSIAVPNLFSKCSFDAVIIINYQNHTLFPKNIAVEDFANTISLASEIIKRVKAKDSSLVHHVLGMNFLNPGGSSVPHPHFQLHIRTVPYSKLEMILSLSKAYYDRYGKNYWHELCEMERQSDRFIGEKYNISWFAAFAPSHQREIWGILRGKSSLTQISEEDALGFAEGIAKVVSFYESVGTHPFTLAFFSAPTPCDEFFTLQVRICSRPAFKSLYANYDSWFNPFFMGDEVHTEAPESYAKGIKALW